MKIEYDTQDQIYSELAKSEVLDLKREESTVGSWRQDRVLNKIRPLVMPKWFWLTVGDGRYGGEASWIIANGGNAHASDYSTHLLELANNNGLIKDFSRQNAEALFLVTIFLILS